DAAPVGNLAVLLVGFAVFQSGDAGHLVTVVQIVDGVKDRVSVRDLDDRAVRKDAAHALGEGLPFDAAVEVVAHEETATQEVFAHAARLLVGQVPVAHFDTVDPWPVPHIALVEIHRLFHTARVKAAQAAHRDGQVAIAARVVHGPVRPALFPGSVEFKATPY